MRAMVIQAVSIRTGVRKTTVILLGDWEDAYAGLCKYGHYVDRFGKYAFIQTLTWRLLENNTEAGEWDSKLLRGSFVITDVT